MRQLESGASDLETSIALWERGEALAARCEAWLQGAQERRTRHAVCKQVLWQVRQQVQQGGQE